MEHEKVDQNKSEKKRSKTLSSTYGFFHFVIRVFVEAPELLLIPLAGLFVLFKFKSAIFEKVIEFFN